MKQTLLSFALIFALLGNTFSFNTTNTNLSIAHSTFNTRCPAPEINSFHPLTGGELTMVTIYGSNFTNTVDVAFNGISNGFIVVSDTEITTWSVSGTNESATISVTSAEGCTGNSADEFSFIKSVCTDNDIYISEIYDAASGSYAVIELYNPSNTPVDLDGVYVIDRYGDIGTPTPSHTYNLLGTIPPMDTFIILLGSGSDCPSVRADFNVTTGINDNDELKLVKNRIAIDVVEAPNERGYTIIRNPDAVAPNDTFTPSDWHTNLNETCTNLGSHTADTISNTIPIITQSDWQYTCENGNASFTVSVATGTYNYQWKTLNSSGNWVNVVNNATYSGANTSTLTLNNVPINFDENQYYCEISSGNCTFITDVSLLFVSTVDNLENQEVCTEYSLPSLTNGNYFTETNGGGTQLIVGQSITTTQLIYIYYESGTAPNICANESSFTVTILEIPPVDTLADYTGCSSYSLPTLTHGSYYTETNGTGMPLNPGESISTTQTIYIYNENDTTPNACSNESSFIVTITGAPPVDTVANQEVCSSFSLPPITNGNYFTGSGGTGIMLHANDVISTDQIIYIYNETDVAPNICFNENSFTVTILGTPPVDILTDQTECSEYILPTLTNGEYYTETNGMGIMLNAGESISTTQTIFIYNEIGTTPNACSNESRFIVTILGTPIVDILPNNAICSAYVLPALTNGNYFTAPNGTGTALFAGNEILSTQTIYIYNETGTAPNRCVNQSSFTITMYPATNFTLTDSNLEINENTLHVFMADTSISYEYAVDNGDFQSNSLFSGLSNGVHTLYVQDENGCIIKSIQFEVVSAEPLHIPPFFTPNGDGQNDVWQITDTQNTIKKILVFDRYGKLLKQISSHSKSWNGLYRGYPMETDDYWYIITLHSGKQVHGHFTLKR